MNPLQVLQNEVFIRGHTIPEVRKEDLEVSSPECECRPKRGSWQGKQGRQACPAEGVGQGRAKAEGQEESAGLFLCTFGMGEGPGVAFSHQGCSMAGEWDLEGQ